MDELVRHRQTKGSATDRLFLNHRATSRLYRVKERFGGSGITPGQKLSTHFHKYDDVYSLRSLRYLGQINIAFT